MRAADRARDVAAEVQGLRELGRLRESDKILNMTDEHPINSAKGIGSFPLPKDDGDVGAIAAAEAKRARKAAMRLAVKS